MPNEVKESRQSDKAMANPFKAEAGPDGVTAGSGASLPSVNKGEKVAKAELNPAHGHLGPAMDLVEKKGLR